MISADTFGPAGAMVLDTEPLSEGMYALLEAVQFGLVPVEDLTDEQHAALAFALPDEVKREYVRDADGRFAHVPGHALPPPPDVTGGGGSEVPVAPYNPADHRAVPVPGVSSPKDSGADYVPMAPGAWTPRLKDAYDAVVKDPGPEAHYPNDPRTLDTLHEEAMRFAESSGISTKDRPGEGAYGGDLPSPAEVYADGILKRALTERMQDRARLAKEDRHGYLDQFDRIRAGNVMIAVPAGSADGVFESGRFKTQFETRRSGGALSPGVRASSETQQFNHAPDMPPEKRTVYGYMAPDGYETASGPKQYGDVRFKLKPQMRDRSTMTIGDSLSTGAIPVAVTGPVTSKQKIRARAIQGYGYDEGVGLANARSLDSYLSTRYAEAQVMGGVNLSDVSEIHVAGTGMTRFTPGGLMVTVPWRDYFKQFAAPIIDNKITVYQDGVPLEIA